MISTTTRVSDGSLTPQGFVITSDSSIKTEIGLPNPYVIGRTRAPHSPIIPGVRGRRITGPSPTLCAYKSLFR